MIAIEPTTRSRKTLPASASKAGSAQLRLRRLEPDHLEPLGLGRDPRSAPRPASRPLRGWRGTPRRRRSRGRSRTRRRPSRGRRRRRCETAVGGDRAAGVERAVDRVDHDPRRRRPIAEGDLAALLGDGDEGGALARPAARARRRRRPRTAVDHQGAVAALADPLVDGALLARPASARRSGAERRRCGGRSPASRRRERPSARMLRRASVAAMREEQRQADRRLGRTRARERAIAHGDGPAAGPRRRRDRQDRAAGAAPGAPGRRAAPRPSSVLVIASPQATARRAARTLRGAARRALRGALDRHLGRDRRAAAARALRGGRASIPSSTSSGRPSGWRCCSTASTSCRCATTRSAATRPGCSPGCWRGSTG